MKNIEKIISKDKLEQMIKRLSKNIVKELGDDLNFVTVLEGAVPFSRDLMKKIFEIGARVDEYFIKVNSYKGINHQEICLEKDLNGSIKRKNIIIVEDIVDSGRTVNFLKNYLINEKKAENVSIVSLLSKPALRVIDVKIDYLGQEIPDKFVVGYGMDFNGKYRDLDYVGILED